MPNTLPHAFDRSYLRFYLQGREEKRFKNNLEEDDVAQIILKMAAGASVSVRDVITTACRAEAERQTGPRVRRRWIDDHKPEITAAGGDEEEAYNAWFAGRVDEYAYGIEDNIISALQDEVLEVEDGDEESDGEEP